jgi:hypothetical protein
MAIRSGRLLAAWIAATLAIACTGGSPPADASGGKGAVATDVPPHDTLVLEPKGGTVRFLRGEDLGAGIADQGAGAEERARAFLDRYGPLFRLEEPRTELALQRLEIEPDGTAHVRFEQRWQALPVPGAELVVHLDPPGRVVAVNGRYVPTPAGLDVRPTLDAAAARRAAARAAGAECEACAVDLVVATADAGSRLAWRVGAPPGRLRGEEIWIDAHSGALLRRVPAVQPALPKEIRP